MLCTSLILGLHLATAHFTMPLERNGLNPGAYAVCDNVEAGAYVNSESLISQHVGYVWHAGPVDIVTGAVHGYRGTRVAPFVVPSLRVTDHVRVALLPPVKLSGWGGLHVSYEW